MDEFLHSFIIISINLIFTDVIAVLQLLIQLKVSLNSFGLHNWFDGRLVLLHPLFLMVPLLFSFHSLYFILEVDFLSKLACGLVIVDRMQSLVFTQYFGILIHILAVFLDIRVPIVLLIYVFPHIFVYPRFGLLTEYLLLAQVILNILIFLFAISIKFCSPWLIIDSFHNLKISNHCFNYSPFVSPPSFRHVVV